MEGERYAVDESDNRYLVNTHEIDGFPGWRVVHLRSLKEIFRVVFDPLVRVTVPTVITLCMLVGLAVFFLYRKASGEIIQRKKIEEALRESEKRYRSVYHNAPAMLHSIDSHGVMVSVSDNWLDAMGYERDEVIGKELLDFLTEESAANARNKVLPEFFRSGFCKDVSYQFIRKDGSSMDVLLSAIGERDSDGNIIRSLAVSIDISDRIAAEAELEKAREKLSLYTRDLELQVKKRTAELRRLSGSILADQERERAAIARGLHDELGQVLTALRLEAVWIKERTEGKYEDVCKRASMMGDLIDDTIDEVRSIALRLRPGILDDLGLVEALEWHVADFERRTGITATFKVSGDLPEFKGNVATTAYRIAQEALTNIMRHSRAEEVGVTLSQDEGQFCLLVEDDGSGFVPEEIDEFKGLGLAGMRERANLVGGTFNISSRPKRGTRVEFRAKIEVEI